MPARRDHARRTGRWPRGRAAAGVLFVVSVLLFTWPFVRSPPLGLEASFVHILGAWAVSIVALAVMARAVRRPRRDDGDRDA